MAGYSGTPLAKKPGIKPGTQLFTIAPPVCAVDEVWSGLKLVIRKQLRQAPGRSRS